MPDRSGSSLSKMHQLITAVWMRAHEAEYQPWLPDKTVDQYCNLSIIPFAVEIEHYSMDALIKAIMYPAGISVDVLYLDRSNSEEANEFHWAPPIPGGGIESLDGGTIRLLYRPYVCDAYPGGQINADETQWSLRHAI